MLRSCQAVKRKMVSMKESVTPTVVGTLGTEPKD